MGEDEAILARLELLRQYQAQLLQIPAANFQEYDRNFLIHKATERLLQTAIEACLDIGKRIIAQEHLRFPQDNQDVFAILGEDGILASKLCSRLQDMARFRNLLVHEYTKIDNVIVYSILKKRLGDFDEFARAIVAYLERAADDNRSTRERRIPYRSARKRT